MTEKDKWYQENKKKGFLDSMQEKVVSRKLLVFLTATGLMAYWRPVCNRHRKNV